MSLESAIVSFTVQKLGDALIQEAELLSDVKDQIESLQRELRFMNGFLKNVDERLEEGDEALRVRIEETRRISFRIEDVIDSFILAGGTRREKNLLRRYYGSFPFLMRTREVAIEIKTIKTRITQIAEMFQRYQVGQTAEPIQRWRPRSYPDRNDDHVVGFENDTTMLLEKLTTENDQTSTLCIVGMGGSGKTTLARKLYNHRIIKRHFKSQAWVSVSQEWNAQQILVDILKQVAGQKKKPDEIGSIEELVEDLRKYLRRTSFLIILDDVWKKESLRALLPAFPIDTKRSRIIVTTRIREVVQFPHLSCFFYKPPRLNESESWELFSKIALYRRQSADVDGFKKLGEQMLKKCDGLPLAIVALGGILAAKENIREWERVSRAVSARVMEAEGGYDYGTVKHMLALSYQELPYDLKACFLYFAHFPEDYEIHVGQMIRMWVAEGFVTSQHVNGEETLEDVAEHFVDELVQRCLIQVEKRDYDGRVESVQIHDLMRDLCIKEAKKREFLEIITSTATTQEVDGAITQSRRVSMCTSSASTINIPDKTQNSHVQSIFVFNYYLARVSLKTMHKNFQLLKVLTIHGASGVLPAEMENLTLLRHLEFSVFEDCELPKSMGNLRNLLTFDFSDKPFTERILPNVFWKMEKLRHLYLRFSRRVPAEGFKLDTLKNLQTLWGVRGGNWMLREMLTLSSTVTKIQITKISSNEQLDAVFQCPSVNSGVLQTLDLQWKDDIRFELQKLELLRCCDHLYKLSLHGRMSESLSSPVQFPSNLMKLYLEDTCLELQETMSALGKLSNLRDLDLLYCSYMGSEWTCSAGKFPQLKKLLLVGLQNLEEWRIEAGAMPGLSNLSIRRCKNMKRLPEGLRHITTLQMLEIMAMPKEFCKRLRQADNNEEIADQGGEDFHIIQHIPVVRF